MISALIDGALEVLFGRLQGFEGRILHGLLHLLPFGLFGPVLVTGFSGSEPVEFAIRNLGLGSEIVAAADACGSVRKTGGAVGVSALFVAEAVARCDHLGTDLAILAALGNLGTYPFIKRVILRPVYLLFLQNEIKGVRES